MYCELHTLSDGARNPSEPAASRAANRLKRAFQSGFEIAPSPHKAADPKPALKPRKTDTGSRAPPRPNTKKPTTPAITRMPTTGREGIGSSDNESKGRVRSGSSPR